MNKRLIGAVIIIILGIGGYYGWQWNLTQNYIKLSTPIFKSAQSLFIETDKTIDNGGRYVDMVDEIKRINKEFKTLKQRQIELVPSNDTSTNIQASMLKLLEQDITITDHALNYLRNDWKAATKKTLIRSLSSDPYLAYYAQSQINEATQEQAEAKSAADSAYNLFRMSQEEILAIEKETLALLEIPY